MTYSPSEINLFFRCPYKWKLLKIDKAITISIPNDYALLGRNMHLIIAEYYNNIVEKPTLKQVVNIAESCFSRFFDPLLKNHQQLAENMLKNFIKFEQKRIPNYIKPIIIERKLKDENFSGIIDYFDGENIIDWKTGRIMGIDDNLRRQGKIYDLLLKHNGYEGHHKIYFITLRNGRSLELPMTTKSWIMSQVNRMYRMVKNKRFPECKTPLCNFCEVQLACEFKNTKLWDEVIL